jgi:hypothetical protein
MEADIAPVLYENSIFVSDLAGVCIRNTAGAEEFAPVFYISRIKLQ